MRSLFRQHHIRKHCDARLLHSGSEYFEVLINVIRNAECHIHFQFYIVEEDITGKRLIAELLAASRRGVKIMMVVDGYGSAGLTNHTLKEFRKRNILFKQFSPIGFSHLKFGRRLHHKIVVVDGITALIGGINISDRYSGFDHKTPWLDFGIELRGKVVSDIERVCEKIWKRRLLLHHGPGQSRRRAEAKPGNMEIRLLQNDWLRRRIEISKGYKDMVRNCEKELILVAGYFFPGNSMLRLLKQGVKRGVKIKIVLGSISDVMIFQPATVYLYQWMFRNKIEIVEWQPSVMHGKLAIADSQLVNVGSYNINALSDYGSLELNVEVNNSDFAESTKANLNEMIRKGGKVIDVLEFTRKSNWVLNGYRWICYQMIRGALRLMFALMQQRKIRF